MLCNRYSLQNRTGFNNVFVEVDMKLNFTSIIGRVDDELENYFRGLIEITPVYLPAGFPNEGRKPPEGYEDYVCVDVLGTALAWMNEHFPKEQYTWYHWFESIFLVTPEMATFLKLKWS